MRVVDLQPDAPPGAPLLGRRTAGAAATDGRVEDASGFARALDAVAGALQGAQSAEDAFAAGRGSLQSAVYERARADVELAVATGAASRCAQAVQSLLNMQL